MPRPLLAVALLLAPAVGRAADPVVVTVRDKAAVGTAAVAVGDVAGLAGGDPAARDRVARLDLAELTARGPAVTLPRRAVEYRIRLAGFGSAEVVVVGADRVTVTADRRPLTPDEVVAAARDELVRRLPGPPGALTVELVRPVVARLPEVPAAEAVAIAAVPHARVIGLGRAQMDVTITAGGEKLLALGVLFEVKAAGGPPAAVVPAGGAMPAAPGPLAEPLVKARQRVTLVVRTGGLNVTAVGEAQQAAALGQTVQVQNVDSKKVVTGRVTGPGTVEIDLGGVPPPQVPAVNQPTLNTKH